MVLDYKKTVFIKSVDTITGIIDYDYIYQIDQNSNVVNEVNLIEKSLNIVDRVPNSGDKMYFLNGVTVPRFKIKEYHRNKGTSVVKYIESSNLVIFSKSSISKYFSYHYLYEYSKNDIIQYLNNWMVINLNKTDKDLILDEKWAQKFIEDLNSCEDVLMKYNYHHKHYLNEQGIYYVKNSNIQFLYSDEYIKLQKIVNIKCDFINEFSLLKELNTSITMDLEMYESIQKLMDSSDKENMKLAMEMMANCNYDSSALYLLLLLKKYNREISNMRSIKHVNFKAMLNYFELSPNSNFNFDIDGLITILKERKIFVKSQMNILIPMILENCNSESPHYKISMVTFIDDEGKDIVVESELPEEPDGELLEAKSETEVCSELYGVDNNPEAIILQPDDWAEPVGESKYEMPELYEIPELDDIIFDELTEAIGYCNRSGFSEQREWLTDIRDQIRSPDALLKLIEFFDKDELSEYIASLTQCYLDMK